MVKYKNKILAFKNQLRRRFIFRFDKRKITEGLKNRRGHCSSCGKCCDAVFHCPMVFKKDGLSLCKIHQHKPVMCELYPFEENDFFKHLKDECTYYFVDENEEKKELGKKQIS